MQKKLIKLIDSSCLFLCYLWYGKQGLSVADTLKYLAVSITKGYVLEDDGFVLDPEGILKLVTDKRYSIKKVYKNPNKICIAEFYNERTDFTHFVIVGPTDEVLYDPLEDSITVKEGKIISYREIIKW